jgi:hypothetical protein
MRDKDGVGTTSRFVTVHRTLACAHARARL